MTSWVAFLRGINVGGRRTTGEEMVAVAIAAGFGDATSYQASGNLVFASDVPRTEIEERLSASFAAAHGWQVEVLARSIDELVALLAEVPFDDGDLATRGKPQIIFTRRTPELGAIDPGRDLLAAAANACFWVPHTGVSDCDLDVDRLAQLVGVNTVRTLGTVERIITKFG